MKGLGGIFSQIQKMQEKMKEVQKDLESKEIEASSGGDMVTVRMNGKKEIVSLKINKEVVDPDDVEMLEDLIVAAVSEAQRKVQEMITQEFSQITGGLNIPGMPDLSNLM
ncbi:MAG: YbaB/EbfC family nucleoid-associated protein [Spirochaetes bacterium]|nr:YbaB/EbfC family nucleoid-associated protein [Spirochaetota bacterium]